MLRLAIYSALSACYLMLGMERASAQFIDWDGGGFNDSWQSTANWNAMPPRIPNAGDIVRIGNLPGTADDTVLLDDDGVGATLVMTSGADVDTNGRSLTIGNSISFGGADANPGELIVRQSSIIGGPEYAARANSVGVGEDGRLRMVGGRLEVLGNLATPGILSINEGATLVGYGVISLQESENDEGPLLLNNGRITVGEPEQIVVGEPPARTLVIETPNVPDSFFAIQLGADMSDVATVERNSTLRLSAPQSISVGGGSVVLEANSTLDLGDNDMSLHAGDILIVNSGAVEGPVLTLPAVPAVIRGTNQFTLSFANLSINRSDEVLVFDVVFFDSGNIFNSGTIRFEADASVSQSAMFTTSGAGQLVNAQSSTLNLYDNANVDSPLVNHGTLTMQLDAEGDATIDTLTLMDSSTLEIDLRSVIPGQFDTLTVEGNAFLDGTLAVEFHPTFVPLLGNSFTIMTTTFGAFSGTFEHEILPTSASGLTIDVLYPNAQTVMLQVVNALIGDYNNNGVVDAADYALWRENAGTMNHLPNDPLGGLIGPAHYDQWRAHFGQTSAGGTALGAAVPEPVSAALSLLGATAFATRCRRRLEK